MTEITAVLSSENGYFHEGYADSIAVTDSRLYVRENYGVSVYGHGLVPRLAQQWDIQGRPGYAKVGDGFQTISNVGTSPDGQRVLLGYKQDTHGTLVLDARYSGNHAGRDGVVIGEFPPPRALGGVTVVQSGGTYTAFALQGGGLSYVDVTAETLGKLKPRRLLAGRNAQGLITVGERAAYVDDGSLVLVKPNGVIQSLPMRAVTLASEGDVLLVGVEGGYRRLGMDTIPLGDTPRAVCLLNGVAYAVTAEGGVQTLYREEEPIFTLSPDTWPVVQLKGFGTWLYAACTKNVLVVRLD